MRPGPAPVGKPATEAWRTPGLPPLPTPCTKEKADHNAALGASGQSLAGPLPLGPTSEIVLPRVSWLVQGEQKSARGTGRKVSCIPDSTV